MAKISEVAPSFESHPLLTDKAWLMKHAFIILNARGPYRSKKIADSQMVILTIMPTEGEFPALDKEQSKGYPNGDDLRDILLSAVPQRMQLVDYFAREEAAEVVGPCLLERLDVGQPSPMWNIIDAE